jgi:hypothetical protein
MQKTFLICNTIVRSVAFVCITLAAIHFESAKLLWWYVVPLLMSPSVND